MSSREEWKGRLRGKTGVVGEEYEGIVRGKTGREEWEGRLRGKTGGEEREGRVGLRGRSPLCIVFKIIIIPM